MGRGKHVRVYLIEVSPLVGSREKACSDNQHAFIPFAFDTFGFLAPKVVDLLHRVQRIMHINVMSPRSMNVVFTMIGCCLLTFYLCVSNSCYILFILEYEK